MEYSKGKYPFQDETYEIIGICMEVHRILGKGLLEVVYKDAIQHELEIRDIPYSREKKYIVEYKDVILPHHFFADFVVHDKIILEVKAQKGIADEHIRYTLNYMTLSECKLGLIVNFGEDSLRHKRLII